MEERLILSEAMTKHIQGIAEDMSVNAADLLDAFLFVGTQRMLEDMDDFKQFVLLLSPSECSEV